jgi:hypothetical protein
MVNNDVITGAFNIYFKESLKVNLVSGLTIIELIDLCFNKKN